jgi:hedgehog signaling domain-containing protein
MKRIRSSPKTSARKMSPAKAARERAAGKHVGASKAQLRKKGQIKAAQKRSARTLVGIAAIQQDAAATSSDAPRRTAAGVVIAKGQLYQRERRAAPPELHLGQRVPETSEVATSGAIRRKIRRGDPEFSTLVANNNPAIVFKNEEATGADRVMTNKLMEKLNALASLVAAEWPGVSLRVTEAWDENDEHAAGSLHYEGRAADLTTSPIDQAKLGRLARLAVDAGFDWVLFENELHVHVSMKR